MNTTVIKCSGPDGRIRVPKQMRESLHIHENEPLMITMDGRRLILEKYQETETLESVCGMYLYAYSKHCRCPIAICNTEHILTAKGLSISSFPLLSRKFQSRLWNMHIYRYDADDPLDLFGDGTYVVDTLVPIFGNNGSIGAVVLLRCLAESKPHERICAEFIADMITEQLKNK